VVGWGCGGRGAPGGCYVGFNAGGVRLVFGFWGGGVVGVGHVLFFGFFCFLLFLLYSGRGFGGVCWWGCCLGFVVVFLGGWVGVGVPLRGWVLGAGARGGLGPSWGGWVALGVPPGVESEVFFGEGGVWGCCLGGGVGCCVVDTARLLSVPRPVIDVSD